MIQAFWNWITSSVSAALNTLNNLYLNETLQPFFNLFLAVFSTAIVIKYIIHPLTGGKGSDKVKKEKEDE